MPGFILARAKSQSIPRGRELNAAAGLSVNVGALVVLDASFNVAECGADPVSIAGVTEGEYGTSTNPLYGTLGARGFPPGKIVITAVQDEVVFHASYVGTLPAANGASYGVVKDADGDWKVDFTDTTATRVKLLQREWTQSPLNVPRVLVSFLAANVQII